jgi:cytochrome c
MLKKFLALSFIASVCFACGNNATSSADNADKKLDSSTKHAAPEDLSKNPDYQKGLTLIAGQDCLTCHKIDETSTGPAYRDVANKYPNDDATIGMLAQKIIKGGSGNWGQVMMTPHSSLSEDDAKQMVKYILLLKNK